MSDGELRELAKAWLEGGEEEGARYLFAALRRGALGPTHVRLAGFLGSKAAVHAAEELELIVPSEWREIVPELDREVRIRLGLEAACAVGGVHQTSFVDELRAWFLAGGAADGPPPLEPLWAALMRDPTRVESERHRGHRHVFGPDFLRSRVLAHAPANVPRFVTCSWGMSGRHAHHGKPVVQDSKTGVYKRHAHRVPFAALQLQARYFLWNCLFEVDKDFTTAIRLETLIQAVGVWHDPPAPAAVGEYLRQRVLPPVFGLGEPPWPPQSLLQPPESKKPGWNPWK